ncbi:MAG: hypothetical protein Q9217_006380 [Psora testacea]
MALPLAGKTAIVTGAGSGINLAFTRLLLSRQCNVLLADLALRPEAEDLVNVHSSRTKLSNGRAVFQHTDVRDWTHLDRCFERARDEFGGREVDVVCPGAGIYEPPFSSFWHPPGSPPSCDPVDGSRYASLDINLTHPIRMTQLAIQHFLSASSTPPSRKSIIHISSIAGQFTPLPAPIYNATKHAINGFVRTLAPLDKRLGIRVTCVAPGVIKTPLWTDHPDKMRLLSRDDEWVAPEAVADVMAALVSEAEIEVHASGAEEFGEGKKVGVQGGMVVEVAKGRRRVVRSFMDPGPLAVGGNTASNMPAEEEMILESLERGEV